MCAFFEALTASRVAEDGGTQGTDWDFISWLRICEPARALVVDGVKLWSLGGECFAGNHVVRGCDGGFGMGTDENVDDVLDWVYDRSHALDRRC